MWSPTQYNLRSLNLLVLINCNEVCKTLQRMPCCRLHAYYRFSRQLYELVENLLPIIIRFAGKICKTPHPNNIAITAHYRNCLQNVLRLVAIHYNTPLSLQFPGPLINVKHNHIHSKIEGSLLCAQPCAQT